MAETALLTDIGLAKIAAAAGSGSAVAITHVALGDGDGVAYEPDAAQTLLQGEVIRRAIDERAQTDPKTWLVRVQFPAETVPTMQLREVGFFDGDGDLIVIVAGAEYPQRTLGGFDLTFEQPLVFSSAAEGVVIVDAPDWELFDHAVLDLEAHAIIFDELFKVKLAQRDAEAALAARDEAAAQMAPVGIVGQFARMAPPPGWIECDGRELSRDTYAALFAAIGIVFGAGDGATTFNIPNIAGEFLRGWDHGRGIDPGRLFGSEQGDAIRDITGGFSDFVYQGSEVFTVGAFSTDPTVGSKIFSADAITEESAVGDRVTFAASQVVPTADENRPHNVAFLFCIRY